MKKKALVIIASLLAGTVLLGWLSLRIYQRHKAAAYCGEYSYKLWYMDNTDRKPKFGYDEHYILTPDTLTIISPDGTSETYPVKLQWTKIDDIIEIRWKNISKYQQKYLILSETEVCPYRIYAMDGEVWLVHTVQEKYINTDNYYTNIDWIYIIQPVN